MILDFCNLTVFSRMRNLLFIGGLVGSVKPSPLGSCGSAQGFLDVSNFSRPEMVEGVEDELLSVLCMA